MFGIKILNLTKKRKKEIFNPNKISNFGRKTFKNCNQSDKSRIMDKCRMTCLQHKYNQMHI